MKRNLKPKCWEETMTPEELDWIWGEIDGLLNTGEYPCADNFRAARYWISSQRRRYRRNQRNGCCGYVDFFRKKWNWRKLRYDLYMIGFNYGH
jgi:hypothetical protein